MNVLKNLNTMKANRKYLIIRCKMEWCLNKAIKNKVMKYKNRKFNKNFTILGIFFVINHNAIKQLHLVLRFLQCIPHIMVQLWRYLALKVIKTLPKM